MNAVDLIQSEVAPVVEKIFAEVSALNFKKVNDEVHHEAEWVLHIREDFHNTNSSLLEEVSRVVQSEKYRDGIEAVGTKCRENMGEELFEKYREEHGVKTSKDLGELLVTGNLLCAIIQKVYGFAEIDFTVQATVINGVRKEMNEMRNNITRLVKFATKGIIEETRGGKIDYFHLELLPFLETFSDKVGIDGAVESKAIDRAFEAITGDEISAKTIAKMIAESDVNPLEVLINSEEVIAQTIHAQVHLALGVVYLWNKRGANELLTMAYMNERIEEVIIAIKNA